ncbi:hypothetical protein DFH29DRAFT_587953 [Suillus ampliporus]|nr:hypothetical protein DFH29DRAFT_587953 [Suillus ampliporus]
MVCSGFQASTYTLCSYLIICLHVHQTSNTCLPHGDPSRGAGEDDLDQHLSESHELLKFFAMETGTAQETADRIPRECGRVRLHGRVQSIRERKEQEISFRHQEERSSLRRLSSHPLLPTSWCMLQSMSQHTIPISFHASLGLKSLVNIDISMIQQSSDNTLIGSSSIICFSHKSGVCLMRFSAYLTISWGGDSFKSRLSTRLEEFVKTSCISEVHVLVKAEEESPSSSFSTQSCGALLSHRHKHILDNTALSITQPELSFGRMVTIKRQRSF